MKDKIVYLLKTIIIANLFYILAKIGLLVPFTHTSVTLFWLPSGFSLAILLIFGSKYFPGISLGAFLANYSPEIPIGFVFSAVVSNTFEPCLSQYILKTKFNFDRSLVKLKDVIIFLVVAVLFVPIFSATIGVLGLCFNGMIPWGKFFEVGFSWWAGNAFGVLVFGSLILVWSSDLQVKPKSSEVIEGLVLFILIVIPQAFIYFDMSFVFISKNLTWTVFPFLIWASLRFSQKIVITFNFVFISLALIGSLNNYGPFSISVFQYNILLLYGFLTVVMTNAMVLKSIMNERTLKEKRIKTLIKEQETLINNITGYVYRITYQSNGRITLSNLSKGFESIYGYTVEEVESLPIKEMIIKILHPDDRYKIREVFWNRKKLKKTKIKNEYRIFTKTGELRWIEDSATLYLNEKGEFVLDGLGIDITERKFIEGESIKSKEQAEAANRAKSDFLANISHEIRTPLNAIIGFAELLTKSSLGEILGNYIQIIFNSANTLLDMINEILDFSKIEAEKLSLKVDRVDLLLLLQQAIDIIKLKAEEKKLMLNLIFPDNIPRFIYTDSIRLKQIFINLLGNSVKFTEEGKIEIQVELTGMSFLENQASITFYIKDTGIGIAKENQKKIFEAFSQVDSSTSRKHGGTGLGLTISNKILGLMKSKLEVDSELGKGSNFHFTLQIQIDSSSEDIKNNSIETKATEIPVWSDKTFCILIADDEEVNLLLARTMIESILPNAIIKEAKNGKEVLKIYKTEKTDLVLMDIQMPEVNGYEAAKEIRKLETTRRTPIIAMTAGTKIGDREKCIDAGMDDYISKPFLKNSLEKIIQNLLLNRKDT